MKVLKHICPFLVLTFILIACSNPTVKPSSLKAALITNVIEGTAPLMVDFDGSRSQSSPNQITRYVFRFGDGDDSFIDSNKAKVSHTYNQAGTYNASLTVYTAQGASDKIELQIKVSASPSNAKPSADFSFTPAIPTAGQAVTFNAKDHSSNTAVKFTFNFGDGSTTVSNNTGTATHTFSAAGKYTVRLQVEDNKGIKSQVTTKVVQIQTTASTKPVADFTFTPTTPVAGQAVIFNAKDHSSNTAVKFTFNFGDGSTTVSNNTGTATHTFAAAGSYNVAVSVEDDKGVKSESKVKVVQVQATTSTKPVADFTFTPAVPVVGKVVTFNAKDHSSNTAVKFTFNFGDGSSDIVNGTGIATHTFATAGKYTVRLQVEDDKGILSETKVREVQIKIATSNPVCEGTFTLEKDLAKVKDCVEIKGDLNIYNTTLTDLSFLNKLEKVTGNLCIGCYAPPLKGPQGNNYLLNLSGLDSLSFIGGHLFIMANDSLESLSGLNNLSTIKGSLFLGNNKVLKNLAGLDNLSSVGESVDIAEAQLTSLSGLDNLSSVGKDLEIQLNPKLTSISGLNKLVSVGEDVSVGFNAKLKNLSGFHNLVSIGGNLYVGDNPNLTDFLAFKKLASVGKEFNISNNSRLPSIAEFSKLTSIGGHLNLWANNSLQNISGFNNLLSIGGNLNINGNDKLTHFSGMAKLSSVGGYVDISDNALTSFSGLNQLASVGKYVDIYANHSDASAAIVSASIIALSERPLSVNNHLLTAYSLNLNSRSSVKSVNISNNASLTSFSGLNNLSAVEGYVDISSNENLTSFSGLNGLVSVNEYVTFHNNPKLTSISGFAKTSSIGGFLHIYENPLLNIIPEFSNLLSIGSLIISGSQLTNLPEFSSLSALEDLTISNNANLTSISRFENLKEIKVTAIISDNPKFDCSPYNQNPPAYFPLTDSTGNKVDCTTKPQ